MGCHFLLKKKMKFVAVWSIWLFLFIDIHSSWRKCHCVSITVVIIQVFRQYLVKLWWNCNLRIWSVKYRPRGGRIFGSPSHLQLHILVYVCAKFHAFWSNCIILSPFHWTRSHFLSKTHDYSLLPRTLLNSVTDGFMRVFWNSCTKTKSKNIQKNLYCGVHFKNKCTNTIYSLLPN